MMEKKKNSQINPKQSLLGCIAFLFFGCFGLCGLLMLTMPLMGKMPRTELELALIPIAETLLNVPHEIVLENTRLYLSVMEDYGQVLASDSPDNDVICVTVSNESLDTSLYIDGALVWGAKDIFNLVYDDLGSPPREQLCAWGELQSGIHLIEFHLKDSFWDEPIHVQQWAIEID